MATGGESSKDIFSTRWSPETDCPLYAMRFAEDLVNYVWKKLDLELPSGNKRMEELNTRQVFLPVIGEAVLELIHYSIKLMSESYKELISRGIQNKDDFRREVCMSASLYFSEGYDHQPFLIFCASLVGVAIFYFEKGNVEIVDASAQIISYILNFYIYQCAFYPAEDWFNLCIAAQDLRRSILSKELNFRMLFPET